ncbi:MAG: flagellin lysine-N-methylase [Ruminococcus sp.]
MQRVYPDYFERFRCIADKCRHNCCIGWEIDIDEKAAGYYLSLEGAFGDELRNNIGFSLGTHYFILGEDERCPFLDKNNLCRIIAEKGKDKLCAICAEHPRFHNELPGRIESGLGLTCEEAGRLVLGSKEKVTLIAQGKSEVEDEIINLRDKIILLLQDRSLPIPKRIDNMLRLAKAEKSRKTVVEWAEFFLRLERLSDDWTELLGSLRERKADTDSFDTYMQGREHEYEQLLVYTVYRHLANASNTDEVKAYAMYTALTYDLLYTLGALLFERNGKFTFEDQVELVRLYSSEIEYSDENLYNILIELSSRY